LRGIVEDLREDERMAMADDPETTRRTRIVATIGPASAGTDVLNALLAAGMDAARVNFSHGDPAESAEVIRRLRELSHSHPRPLAVIADLPVARRREGLRDDGVDDGRRRIVLSANAQDRALSDVVGDIRRVVAEQPLPAGYVCCKK
jgi:pyruvate kinase